MTERSPSGAPGPARDPEPNDGVPAWHIVLVGLPGTGKTSVGRRLAKELERPFADVDEQVELAAGTSIRRLFREQGEGPFRALETQVLAQLLAHPAPLVLAAGGGVVTRPENRALLRGDADDDAGAGSVWPAAGVGQRPEAEAGAPPGTGAGPVRHRAWVVWLQASAEFLAQRTDPAHRPLLADDPVGALTRLEAERAALYAEVADEAVDVEPFHAPPEDGDEDAPGAVKPKHALARHIIAQLGSSVRSVPVAVPSASAGAERGATP